MNLNLTIDTFKCAGACDWWLWFILYFNFCCFRVLA